MNHGPTQPFTTTFGAVPRPEEPARWADPPPPLPMSAPANQYLPTHHYPAPQRPMFSPAGPQANATVVNNIRMGGGYGRYRRCNHLLHGSLTALTCGLWAPVWFLAWVTGRQH